MGIINKNDLLSAMALPITTKSIDGLGEVAFKPLSRRDTWEFAQKRDSFNDIDFSCWLIGKMVVDESGDVLLSDAEAQKLADTNSDLFDTLFGIAYELSGLKSSPGKSKATKS